VTGWWHVNLSLMDLKITWSAGFFNSNGGLFSIRI